MERRTKIIIGVAIGILVLIIIAVLVWLFMRNNEPAPQIVPPTNESNVIPPVLPTSSAGEPDEIMPIEEQNLRSELTAIARTFAERFGSYSSEGNFSNLIALQDIMTVKMKAFSQSYIADAQGSSASDVFYGVTTRAISAAVDEVDEAAGLAAVTVSTQRIESRGTTENPRVYYQSLVLGLALVDGQWKVDTATWQ